MPSLMRIVPDEPFGDAAGFRGALALDRDAPRHLTASVDRFDRDGSETSTDARFRWQRRHEAHAIDAVVDRHANARTLMACRMSALTSDSVRNPCAIVDLNGDSAAARAGST